MDQQQQDLRRAATEAFMESLQQLQTTLQIAEDESMAESKAPTVEQAMPSQPEGLPQDLDLSSFEQAAADIEQFIAAKQERVKGNQPK
jgi:hypothetical protein